MRLILSLPVLVVVVLLMVLEGPAPAQGAPNLDLASTFKNIPNSLKEFGNTLKDAFKSIPEATGRAVASLVSRLEEGIKGFRKLQN